MSFTSSGAIKLHYLVLGDHTDSTPAVLVHGLGADLSFWFKGIANALSKERRVVLYDLRGHGYSDMPHSGYTIDTMATDLKSLVDELRIQNFHLVGHSFGARISILFSSLYPAYVKSLTIADTQLTAFQTPLRLKDWPYWQCCKEIFLSNGLEVPSDTQPIDFNLLHHLSALSSTEDDRIQARSLKPLSMRSRAAKRWSKLLSTTTSSQDFEQQYSLSADVIRQLAVPVLCIYGEQSHCLPTCNSLSKEIKDCDTVVLPNVGHFHPAFYPKSFIDSVNSFFSRVDPTHNNPS